MLRKATTGLGCIAVIAITAVLMATATNARPSDGECKGRRAGLARAIEAMELDEETRAEVDALFETARSHKQDTRDELREAREALRDLLSQTEPEEEAVLAQADAIAAIQGERQRHKVETMLAVRQLVGPEAWAEFEANHEPRRGMGRPLER